MSVWIGVSVVLALILVEGVFVAAEISLISLRDQQVKALAARSRLGKRVAALAADPNRFLAAGQLGVTLTALLSSAFGAVTLSGNLRDGLVDAGLGRTLAGVIGFIGVTVVITMVTLVIGELAPKRLALQRAETAALRLAPFLEFVARMSRPVIWSLSRATDGVVRMLGGDPDVRREAITEEELRGLVASHESLSSDERRLIDDVFAAGERSVREVMVPRTEVEFVDAVMTVTRAARELAKGRHSRYPVVRGSHDDVVGFVHVRDLFSVPTGKRGIRVGEVARPVKMLPATKTVLPALSELRREGHHLAIVVDEYGGTAGIVTLEDLIEEVVGEIRDEYDREVPEPRRLRGGDVEVDGLLNLDEFTEATGVQLPEGPYETAAGFVVNRLGHLPRVGEAVEDNGVRLSVSQLDGRRIERLRVSLPDAAPDIPTENAEAHGDGLRDSRA